MYGTGANKQRYSIVGATGCLVKAIINNGSLFGFAYQISCGPQLREKRDSFCPHNVFKQKFSIWHFMSP